MSLTLRGTARQPSFVTAPAHAREALDLDWLWLARFATMPVDMRRSTTGQLMHADRRRARFRNPADGRRRHLSAVGAGDARVPRALAFVVRAIDDDNPTLLLIDRRRSACPPVPGC